MNDLDFAIAWEGAAGAAGPWGLLRILSIQGREAIGSLYRYEIDGVILDPDPGPDPDELIGARATLRITTRAEPAYRLVHGLISEAEELAGIPGATRYRLVISPPVVRAAHRTRSRIFLEKTTRQIIDLVLGGDSGLSLSGGTAEVSGEVPPQGFTAATDAYAWRVSDTSRLDDATARPYCVQYNESDLAFVSRLLEEEGIGYHFEHGDSTCLMVLADTDGGRTRLAPFLPLGPESVGRTVKAMRLGARLRPRKVTLLEYNWKKPALAMTAEAPGGSGDLMLSEYPGLYPETPAQGMPLATAKLDRLGVEASYAVGEGSARMLSAGTIFAYEHPIARYDGEYLVTQLEVHASQGGGTLPAQLHGLVPTIPYTCTFECARCGKGPAVAESRFRPARVTPKPRIVGSQTAFVTAAPSAAGAEIHIGGPAEAEIGCVRVKFHWDTDTTRHAGEATSCWVRVNQVFAGLGQGSVFHPRVGVEVIVDFEDGDPDRPLVVGRVYNGQNQPSTIVPSISTFKTDTTPGGGSHNELMFDDTAGAQQIKMHTPRDWNSEVGNDRSEQVAQNSTSSVGSLRNEATGSNRSTMVGANNSETVAGNEALMVGGNQSIAVGQDQTFAIQGDQTTVVTGNQRVAVVVDQGVEIGGKQAVAVTGDRSIAVQGNLTEAVVGRRTIAIEANDLLEVKGQQTISIEDVQVTAFAKDHQLSVGGDHTTLVQGDQYNNVSGLMQHTTTGAQRFFASSQQLSVDGSQLLQSTTFDVEAQGAAAINTTQLALVGDAQVSISGSGTLVINFKGDIAIQGSSISLQGDKVSINGKQIAVSAATEVDVQGALIKLN